ncbi:hypothetical protein [Janthinobacterium aquaticum]|uniref:hypothetical protein n=1 Tax=Janthinobacterium sp. FT58W TaxID=2654254 RepID=UPI001264534A|nr:hypothetical protein [Janthinobacterium sp. FT58W]KAB8043299.1 hypothetical protein GCM43_08205 [Janthinobacterium sp. FT58W]
MAKTNFQYEKRQKELEKKKKAEEKARRKFEAKNNPKPAVDENGIALPDEDEEEDEEPQAGAAV